MCCSASRTWALTATVRSSIHDLIWDCRHCFKNKTLFFVSVELGVLGFWCKTKQLIISGFVGFCFWTVIANHSTPKSWYFWCVVKRSRTWALTATVPSIHDLIWGCRHLLHEQNPFRCCWIGRARFLINKQLIMRDSLHDLIWDCRNCFKNKTSFFRFCWMGARFLM